MDLVAILAGILDYVTNRFGTNGLIGFLLGGMLVMMYNNIKNKIIIITLGVVLIFVVAFLLGGEESQASDLANVTLNNIQNISSGW